LAGYAAQRLAAHFNVQISDAQRAEYANHVVHALNLAAPIAEKMLAGRGQMEIKNRALIMVADYMRAHHDDLGKAIGIDLSQSSGVERVNAQAESAIYDPMIATPTVLGGNNAGISSPQVSSGAMNLQRS
jgi:hypothetical protein